MYILFFYCFGPKQKKQSFVCTHHNTQLYSTFQTKTIQLNSNKQNDQHEKCHLIYIQVRLIKLNSFFYPPHFTFHFTLPTLSSMKFQAYICITEFITTENGYDEKMNVIHSYELMLMLRRIFVLPIVMTQGSQPLFYIVLVFLMCCDPAVKN